MPFQPSSSAIWTAISALFGSQGSHLMQPSAMTAVLNRFPDLLDMAVQEASTLGLSARQAISSLRGVLTCIGNQVRSKLLSIYLLLNTHKISVTISCSRSIGQLCCWLLFPRADATYALQHRLPAHLGMDSLLEIRWSLGFKDAPT